ncbi:RagB/SusD family nutrient uptake outer membrane protein [Sphingobacterium sp. LRF_L2]|uniref:RagB/SusD family nutrient uptake outer membrane protein n=1 Tax=Sphingobacterium sp. LRF_L2 TaxID=3369421 RepID=UPI003F5F2BB0
MLKKYLLLLAFGASILSSCKKDLLEAESQSSLDASVIFTTSVLAEGAYTGVVQSFMETNSHRSRYLSYYGANTDVDVYLSLKNISDDRTKLVNYKTNVGNTNLNLSNDTWAMMYQGIERANIAIYALNTYNDIPNNSAMAQLLGEFMTIRAVMYCELIKAWGDVPMRFDPITTETTNLPRTDKYVIYKRLLADLEEAQNYLPWPNQSEKTKSVERVSKSFAKALRARIALYAAGVSQNMDGTTGRTSDSDMSTDKLYTIAKEECQSIVDAGVNQLQSFETVFRTLMEEKGTAGLESIWEIPFKAGRGRIMSAYAVRHVNVDKYTNYAGGGSLGPNPIMWYEYEKEDVRRNVSVVPYRWDGGKQSISSASAFYYGKFRYEWMTRDLSLLATSDDGMNWMYMRYGDVILMLAEAYNELGDLSNAKHYLELIRNRAYPDNPEMVTTYMAGITDQTGFRNAIINERALEFCGEMLRKADLIRWGKLSEKLELAKSKLQQLDTKTGAYASYPTKVYYKTLADNETLEIYGLEKGHTDAYGAINYTSSTNWQLASSSDNVGEEYWNCLFRRDPNSQQYWPIFQYFLDNSNGVLTNGGVTYE